MGLQIAAHRPNGFRPTKIADDRNHEVPGFEILQQREAGFARQVTPIHAFLVGGRHELRVGGRRPDGKPAQVERAEDVLDALEIF